MPGTTVPYEKGRYTLYSNALCPYAQRALRAFKASGVAHRVVEIDLQNKPSWYGQVNPQLKVPALQTPDGTILIESLVIAEFVADAFPQAKLLPQDATERAQLRLFIELFGSRFNPFIYRTLMTANADDQKVHIEALLSALREASKELEKQWKRPSGNGGPFWSAGKFGFAEIALASFVNLLVVLRHYRGVEVPDTQKYAAFNRWRDAFTKDPLFTEINADHDALIAAYKKFAA
ncbi:hypothetical protein IW140_002774 [Coemansia sp. RSA 1813]|nr:hypothetical protein EV178_003654 [Coemansia sp. RSA 1646]KAJ1770255.1 hypothetical protein LPJ74_003316 [Coemansia sp. RSA 1843]KAJ2087516.1 hypothetical protein IW138_004886 [Coemansia sp. RSA 986]KAJ2213803.1 hypothetical protein EV179_003502 [Coemansia sp. RSA 487]KAJ2569886.1 hypothetical protein IW140_002774 [Coemansia sp. RSA 1813]